MRRSIVICLAASLAALVAVPAYAARDNIDVRGRVAISLGDFDIVIGDMGDRSTGWSNSPTRVHVEVLDGRRRRDHYFDSLPAALFVLREMYGAPRILQLDVPEYAGQRHLNHGHTGHGLIDGTQAYYVWDYDQYSRGGMPLVMAFSSYGDALDELQYRNGELMDFSDLVEALYSWAQSDRDRIYWRGWDRDRWDSDRWNNAWDNRWHGWGWDSDRGWCRFDADRDDDNWGRNRRNHNRYNRGRGDHDERDRDRDDREEYDRRHNDSGQGDRARGDGRQQDDSDGDQGQENTDRHSGRVRNTGTEKAKDSAKGKVESNKSGTNRQSGRVR